MSGRPRNEPGILRPNGPRTPPRLKIPDPFRSLRRITLRMIRALVPIPAPATALRDKLLL
jgi:hypothetical protein